MSPRLRRRTAAWLASVVAAAAVVAGVGTASAQEPTRPNVLLIVLDDATLPGANDMLTDAKARIVGAGGVAYTNSYVDIPACCPERASLLTGQYPHNNGVRQQQLGGTLDKRTTLPADLHRAGYRTYHVGKFLHEPLTVNPPPGVFDEWMIGMGGYWSPSFNLNGRVQKIPGYTTTSTGAYARKFLADAKAADDAQPWYLSLNFKAPHLPADPETKYANLPVPPFTFPAETDRSDKPPYVRNVSKTAAQMSPTRIRMWRTLASVDDQVVLTLDWLQTHGELQNTLVILTSDNGFLFGENGRSSKFVPYTNSIRVPLWMRGPGVPAQGTNTTRMVSGVDVAPTIYAATGVTPSRVQDGVSLLGPTSRSRIYAEYFNDPANSTALPPWATLRGPDWQYIETYDITTGALWFQEYYDLAKDPWMLTNLLHDGTTADDPPAALIQQLHAQLQAARTCAGATCPR